LPAPTLGNLVGGFVFTGLAIYLTYRSRPMPEDSRSWQRG
jgi:formate/nitrite transporter FocA (FNT family)